MSSYSYLVKIVICQLGALRHASVTQKPQNIYVVWGGKKLRKKQENSERTFLLTGKKFSTCSAFINALSRPCTHSYLSKNASYLAHFLQTSFPLTSPLQTFPCFNFRFDFALAFCKLAHGKLQMKSAGRRRDFPPFSKAIF